MAEPGTGQPASTVRAAVDAFLPSPRCANRNTRRAYASVLDRLPERLGPDRPLTEVGESDLVAALEELWGQAAPATWNRNRAAVSAWLTWCTRASLPAPRLPESAERRPEPAGDTRALPRAAVERLLARRDIPLRERTLWRMLYETAAPVGEILALDVEDLDLAARRAQMRSKYYSRGFPVRDRVATQRDAAPSVCGYIVLPPSRSRMEDVIRTLCAIHIATSRYTPVERASGRLPKAVITA